MVRADNFVALASPRFNLLKIKDTNAAPAVIDHPGLLQFARDLRHGGTADAHHLGEKFLCQGKLAADEIVHAQQPFTRSRLNIVNRVASCGLLHLR
jgi:hypothetical protein